ncbi:hypothetical protein FKM82_009960 [Ascaphus truei]
MLQLQSNIILLSVSPLKGYVVHFGQALQPMTVNIKKGSCDWVSGGEEHREETLSLKRIRSGAELQRLEG